MGEFLQVALDLRADFPMEDIMHRLNRPYRLKFRADALSPQNFRAEEIVLGVILGVVLDVVLRSPSLLPGTTAHCGVSATAASATVVPAHDGRTRCVWAPHGVVPAR